MTEQVLPEKVVPIWMDSDPSPPTHQEVFSAVHHHARAIARLTAAVPVECKPVPPARSRAAEVVNAVGRYVGDDLWWDIDGESISDKSLRDWCRLTLPDWWNTCNSGILNYHCAAFKHRRDALREYLK